MTVQTQINENVSHASRQILQSGGADVAPLMNEGARLSPALHESVAVSVVVAVAVTVTVTVSVLVCLQEREVESARKMVSLAPVWGALL